MDKVREEFEVWALSEAERTGYAYMDKVLSKFGESYTTTWVDSAWIGWQASRAALCVELPYSGFSEFDGDALHGYATAIDLVRDALIDAGVGGK